VHYLVKARAQRNMWLLSVMKRWHFSTALSVNFVMAERHVMEVMLFNS